MLCPVRQHNKHEALQGALVPCCIQLLKKPDISYWEQHECSEPPDSTRPLMFLLQPETCHRVLITITLGTAWINN